MKFATSMKCLLAGIAAMSICGASLTLAQDKPSGDMAEINIKLPRPAYQGTPKNPPAGRNVEKPTGKPRPAFKAPKGTTNISMGKKVTSSDMDPIIGKLDQITDGEKEGTDGNWVELGPGKQWVQVDLGKESDVYAVLIWHNFGDPRVYKGVVVQISDDPNFIKDVQTVYNNDFENTNGMGVGKDKEYFETHEGRLIDAKGAKGRYVRLYSNGNTSDDQNQYVEVEVWGIQK